MNHEYHNDARGQVFNVKFYAHTKLADGGSDAQREHAFERAQESWWLQADENAKERGFSGVYSCGRSGGYCYPHNNEHAVTADDLENDSELSARFDAFGDDLDSLMKAFPEMFADELQQVIADDTEAATEAARVAAIPGDLAQALQAYMLTATHLQKTANPEDWSTYGDWQTLANNAARVLAAYDAECTK